MEVSGDEMEDMWITACAREQVTMRVRKCIEKMIESR